MRIILQDSCNDIYLPQNVYGLNQYVGKKNSFNWQWDNLNRQLFIDKFLVTFNDLYIWAYLTKNRSILEKIKKKHLSWLPATSLTQEEMKQYCSFRGKQQLTAKAFDAATFLPHKTNSKIVYRSPSPFGHHKRNWPFSKNVDLKTLCKTAFTKECISKLKAEDITLASYSWSGIFEIFGGPLEYQKNNLIPKENLFVSSKYLSKTSSWHQLGKRSSWEESNNKNLLKITGKTNPDIAFRCMRYMYNENR